MPRAVSVAIFRRRLSSSVACGVLPRGRPASAADLANSPAVLHPRTDAECVGIPWASVKKVIAKGCHTAGSPGARCATSSMKRVHALMFTVLCSTVKAHLETFGLRRVRFSRPGHRARSPHQVWGSAGAAPRLCSCRKSDPRGTNCVMMDRLGGCAHAPMNITCRPARPRALRACGLSRVASSVPALRCATRAQRLGQSRLVSRAAAGVSASRPGGRCRRAPRWGA